VVKVYLPLLLPFFVLTVVHVLLVEFWRGADRAK
jgi:hypothetical protein